MFPSSTIAPECALPLLSDSAPVQNRDTKADRREAPSLKVRGFGAPLWMLLVGLSFCGLIGTFVKHAMENWELGRGRTISSLSGLVLNSSPQSHVLDVRPALVGGKYEFQIGL